jgi:hypothetical protein
VLVEREVGRFCPFLSISVDLGVRVLLSLLLSKKGLNGKSHVRHVHLDQERHLASASSPAKIVIQPTTSAPTDPPLHPCYLRKQVTGTRK